MPKRTAGRKLSFADLRAARLAYQAGDTFDAIAARYGVSESGIHKLLRATGIEARARGIPAATIPPLAIEDARAGLSAHTIARKHGLPRHRVNDVLRDLGLARAPRQRILHPLGATITNAMSRARRRARLVIAVRTPGEQLLNAWTPRERQAVFHEIRAGRVIVAPRGQSGLRDASVRDQINSWFARWRATG